MAIGERLKSLRISKGESLQQLADAIGASKAHIWELEANKSRNPSLDLLKMLAQHFSTTVAYLIAEEESEERAGKFFRRNQNKLESLDGEEEKLIEMLLDRLSENKRG